jgi:hypothetical protein
MDKHFNVVTGQGKAVHFFPILIELDANLALCKCGM